MRISRPSPAMVVAIISLVVATAGTATAASIVIRSSSQVARGSINGGDLAKKTVTPRNIDDGAVRSRQIHDGSVTKDKLDKSLASALVGGGGGGAAIEAVRKDGPDAPKGGPTQIASLKGLPPGAYLITAKTVVTAIQSDAGLIPELLKPNKTASARCLLDAAGDSDAVVVPIASPFSLDSATANMQITRTLPATSDISLTCNSDVPFRAAATSIIAVKLSGVIRQDSTG